MPDLRGRFINLRESTDRRKEIEDQLDELNVSQYYERFEAIRGEKYEAERRGLNSGELGLWKSWLKILEEEENLCQQDYVYLHIIEDDCILNEKLYSLLQNNRGINRKFDAIATDMYVNPSVYEVLKERCILNRSNSVTQIVRLYTGCTSSVLIHSSKIKKVYSTLAEVFANTKILLPIDNYFRKSDKDDRLCIGVTLPFLSSIRQERIVESTIQGTGKENSGITLTQELCSILRKELSISPNEANDIKKLIEVYAELVRHKEGEGIGRTNNDITIEAILKGAEQKKILEYKYRKGLKGEANNPQNKK